MVGNCFKIVYFFIAKIWIWWYSIHDIQQLSLVFPHSVFLYTNSKKITHHLLIHRALEIQMGKSSDEENKLWGHFFIAYSIEYFAKNHTDFSWLFSLHCKSVLPKYLFRKISVFHILNIRKRVADMVDPFWFVVAGVTWSHEFNYRIKQHFQKNCSGIDIFNPIYFLVQNSESFFLLRIKLKLLEDTHD